MRVCVRACVCVIFVICVVRVCQFTCLASYFFVSTTHTHTHTLSLSLSLSLCSIDYQELCDGRRRLTERNRRKDPRWVTKKGSDDDESDEDDDSDDDNDDD